MRLSHFQDAFSATLLRRGNALPPVWLAALEAQPGFAVYRNTILTGCIDALEANYPTVRQIVGHDWFRASAAVYARASPPRDGLLMNYGAGFADFLCGYAPAAGLPYLPAVARLDRCWTECHLAHDADAIDRPGLARLPPDALATLRLRPHPAARWAGCNAHPAFALWRRHREGKDVAAPLEWKGDVGLLTRPQSTVIWRPLARAGTAFLDACAEGLTLEAAATRALEADGAINFAALMGELLDAGALTLPNSPTSETA